MLSLVLGYVVMLVAVLAGQVAFSAFGSAQPGEQPDTVYFVFNLATGFFYLIIGGYVTALLAGHWELEHALGLAALSVTMCIVSLVKYAGDQPLWYSIALMFLSIPGTLIGGHYRARQIGDGRERVVAD
jgi:peptidoglycan/LPS O-acetylase OafA/YrhL